MDILAFDCAANTVSAAFWRDGEILDEQYLNLPYGHSETLMPMIARILSNLEIKLCALDYIAATTGPGSYTSMRVGASTAKSLSHATGIPIIKVPTLDALAYNMCMMKDTLIVPVIDARRDCVYTCFYLSDGEVLRKLTDCAAMPNSCATDTANRLREEHRLSDVVFLGNPPKTLQVKEHGFLLAPPNNSFLRASSVAHLARLYMKENLADYENFEVMYLRREDPR
ncbi:tRNA (adenosine(37)-N6)-threonylcarbamoyltransferase complex dimerization subunit type 1 TsaB [Clostridia bacterium]|nr:tRNA (adenosine(37)-N6)-threonylcarbamoyltransferase complex dimerization subunit type 1 TsaB [Clostridia bacterium]